jgi:hypothetical protein
MTRRPQLMTWSLYLYGVRTCRCLRVWRSSELDRRPAPHGTLREEVRTGLHIAVLAALLFSFGKAPFDHNHDSDPHHKHATGISHTHWPSEPDHHRSDSPRLSATDHSDARMLDWLPSDGRTPDYFAVDLPESIAFAAPARLTVRVPETSARGHDPPALVSITPRAPPA